MLKGPNAPWRPFRNWRREDNPFFNEMRLVIAGIDGMVGVNLGQSGSICSKGFENAYIWPFGQGSEVIHP